MNPDETHTWDYFTEFNDKYRCTTCELLKTQMMIYSSNVKGTRWWVWGYPGHDITGKVYGWGGPVDCSKIGLCFGAVGGVDEIMPTCSQVLIRSTNE